MDNTIEFFINEIYRLRDENKNLKDIIQKQEKYKYIENYAKSLLIDKIMIITHTRPNIPYYEWYNKKICLDFIPDLINKNDLIAYLDHDLYEIYKNMEVEDE